MCRQTHEFIIYAMCQQEQAREDTDNLLLISVFNTSVLLMTMNNIVKVGVQMNVVPRSTGNTNSGTRELTLKCKLKCYFKPMNNPLGVSPSKGKQGTTRGKEKIF